MILSEYTRDEKVIAAGLLHDVLEDVKGYGRKRLKEDFGPEIAKIVEEVSDGRDPDAGEHPVKTWQIRRDKYLKRLPYDSCDALLVCAADKIHNMLSMRDLYLEEGRYADRYFHASLKDRMEFIQAVIRILEGRIDGRMWDRLAEAFKDARQTAGWMAFPARMMSLGEDYENLDLECSVCGWKGKAGPEIEATDCVLQVECPVCDKMLLVVG